MKFAGELIVKAPREQVFDRLKDAPFFASCVEGVRDLKELQFDALKEVANIGAGHAATAQIGRAHV